MTRSVREQSDRVRASWVVVSALLTGCPRDVVVGESINAPIATGDAGAGDAGFAAVTCERDHLPSPEGDVVTEVATRAGRTCVLTRRGRVRCWGSDGWFPSAPVPVPGLACVRTLSDGGGGAFVLDDGTARAFPYPPPPPFTYAWGLDPVIGAQGGPTDVVGVTGGAGRSCTWHGDGAVRCWGEPFFGLPNDASVTSPGRRVIPVPTVVESLVDVVQVSTSTDVGPGFACAVHRDHTVSCLGANGNGQLGDGTTTPRAASARVAGLTDVAQVSVNLNTACATRNDGRVLCWGRNDRGQLGANMYVDTRHPVEVPGVVDATQVAVGHLHVCARTLRGTVLCWGNNEYGELGDGTTTGRAAAVEVPGLGDVTQVTAGPKHTCALSADGAVRCWGSGIDALPGGSGRILSPSLVTF